MIRSPPDSISTWPNKSYWFISPDYICHSDYPSPLSVSCSQWDFTYMLRHHTFRYSQSLLNFEFHFTSIDHWLYNAWMPFLCTEIRARCTVLHGKSTVFLLICCFQYISIRWDLIVIWVTDDRVCICRCWCLWYSVWSSGACGYRCLYCCHQLPRLLAQRQNHFFIKCLM